MCVELTVYFGRKAPPNSWLTRRGTPDAEIELIPSGGKGSALIVSTPTEGCTCSLLAGKRNARATTWNFDRRWLPVLAAAIQDVHDKSDGSISLTCLWTGDDVLHTETVPIRHLVDLVMGNRLGTRTRYVVRRKA